MFGSFIEAVMAQGIGDVLQAGLSLESVQNLERFIQKPLPPSYMQFLTTWNGRASFQDTDLGGVVLYPMDLLMEEYSRLRETSYWPAEWIPFCGSDCGDWYCFDTSRRRPGAEYMIIEVCHEGPESTDYNTSFDRWLNAWALRAWGWTFYAPTLFQEECIPVRALRAAVDLDPEMTAPRYHLGCAFYEMGQYRSAAMELEQVLDYRRARHYYDLALQMLSLPTFWHRFTWEGARVGSPHDGSSLLSCERGDDNGWVTN